LEPTRQPQPDDAGEGWAVFGAVPACPARVPVAPEPLVVFAPPAAEAVPALLAPALPLVACPDCPVAPPLALPPLAPAAPPDAAPAVLVAPRCAYVCRPSRQSLPRLPAP